jgi:hypothetical protein
MLIVEHWNKRPGSIETTGSIQCSRYLFQKDGKWNRNRKCVFQLFYEKLELEQKKSHSQSCRNEHCKRDCGLKNLDSCFRNARMLLFASTAVAINSEWYCSILIHCQWKL